ncbi:SDR family oxidoreductase [Rhizobium ruizarguesonis]
MSTTPRLAEVLGTKGALAIMRTLAVEQGSGNIRFNAINAGIILTPMADDVIDLPSPRALSATRPFAGTAD